MAMTKVIDGVRVQLTAQEEAAVLERNQQDATRKSQERLDQINKRLSELRAIAEDLGINFNENQVRGRLNSRI